MNSDAGGENHFYCETLHPWTSEAKLIPIHDELCEILDRGLGHRSTVEGENVGTELVRLWRTRSRIFQARFSGPGWNPGDAAALTKEFDRIADMLEFTIKLLDQRRETQQAFRGAVADSRALHLSGTRRINRSLV